MSLMRRRAMMAGNGKKDEWDIKLYPDETGEIQAQMVLPPSTAKVFIIELDVTVKFRNYVYDARSIVPYNAPQSYLANLPNGKQTVDRSTLFSDNDSVGKGMRLSVGGNRSLEERVSANYLYLKWMY